MSAGGASRVGFFCARMRRGNNDTGRTVDQSGVMEGSLAPHGAPMACHCPVEGLIAFSWRAVSGEEEGSLSRSLLQLSPLLPSRLSATKKRAINHSRLRGLSGCPRKLIRAPLMLVRLAPLAWSGAGEREERQEGERSSFFASLPESRKPRGRAGALKEDARARALGGKEARAIDAEVASERDVTIGARRARGGDNDAEEEEKGGGRRRTEARARRQARRPPRRGERRKTGLSPPPPSKTRPTPATHTRAFGLMRHAFRTPLLLHMKLFPPASSFLRTPHVWARAQASKRL